MKISFKPKEKAPSFVRSKAENAAAMLLRKILIAQRRLADKMQNRSNKWSRKRKIIYLVLFVLLGCMFNIAPLVLTGHQTIIKVPISKPATPHIHQKLDPTLQSPDSAQYKRIYEFKLYLDSLKTTEPGRQEYDRIKQRHQGLVDSLERFYRFVK